MIGIRTISILLASAGVSMPGATTPRVPTAWRPRYTRACSHLGKPSFFASSPMSLGYMVVLFSGFSAWVQLGVLTALMAAVSALATLTIIPALIMTFRPRLFTIQDKRAWSSEEFELRRASAR